MNHKIFLSIIALSAVFTTVALQKQKIVINTNDGQRIEYQTNLIQEVRFADVEMEVITNDGQETFYNVNEIGRVQGLCEAVDLGLSVKWASVNIGAQQPEEYGQYFSWGETEPKDNYSSGNYTWYNKSNAVLESEGVIDANGNLTAEYDAATVILGSEWRTPTIEEITELLEKCGWFLTTQNDVICYKVIGPNGNSICLPTAGYYDGKNLTNAAESGLFMSSSISRKYGTDAYLLNFGTKFSPTSISYYKYFGYTIRPVTD